jgi:hypothetical protein
VITEYTDHASWRSAGQAAGYIGPFKIQGFNRWQFTIEGKVVGVWTESRGHIAAPGHILPVTQG